MAGTRPVRQSRCALGLLVAALALTSGCGSSTSSTGAASPSFYGIVPFGPLDGGDFNRMQAAGVGSLRFLIQWPAVQASADAPFDFGVTDGTVALAAQHHMKMLATLSDTPSFVEPSCAGAGCSIRVPVETQAERAGWERFLRAVVARYGPQGSFWHDNPSLPRDPITRWEIWNEQNNPVQGNPAQTYAKLLALSARTLRSVEPQAEVVLGGMFGTPKGFRHPGVTAWSYLKLVYRAGAANDFDAVALHPYSPTVAGIRYQIEKIRDVMTAHGGGTKPILITEIGWGSGAGTHHPGTGSRGQTFVVTPPQQAKKLTASFQLLTSHRASWQIGGVYWFTWKDPLDPPPGLCAFCYSSGLYHANGRTAKPALSAFERFTRHALS